MCFSASFLLFWRQTLAISRPFCRFVALFSSAFAVQASLAAGYTSSTGAYIDGSCVSESAELRRVWDIVLQQTNAQISQCAEDLQLPQLTVAIDFLNQSRIYCSDSKTPFEVGGYTVDPREVVAQARGTYSWYAWAPFSLLDDPLPMDWLFASENLRVIVFNIFNLIHTRDGKTLPFKNGGRGDRGPEAFASSLFHEALHYLSRLGHHDWREKTGLNLPGFADPIRGVQELCFSQQLEMPRDWLAISLQAIMNKNSSFGTINAKKAAKAAARAPSKRNLRAPFRMGLGDAFQDLID